MYSIYTLWIKFQKRSLVSYSTNSLLLDMYTFSINFASIYYELGMYAFVNFHLKLKITELWSTITKVKQWATWYHIDLLYWYAILSSPFVPNVEENYGYSFIFHYFPVFNMQLFNVKFQLYLGTVGKVLNNSNTTQLKSSIGLQFCTFTSKLFFFHKFQLMMKTFGHETWHVHT